MIAVAAGCGACSVVYPGIQVGPSFRVKVEDHGRPVKGLRVEIGSSRGGGGSLSQVTDRNGFTVFHDVRPGSYYLGVDHDDGVPDGAALEVKLDGPTGVTVPLRWPSVPPVLVRSLKGTIRSFDALPGQPQPSWSLALLQGVSGRWLQSEKTTEAGEFDFGSVAPGFYFLSLKPSGGLIAVAVDHSAPTDHLHLELGWSSCGLYYTDRSKCAQSDAQIEKLSGRVTDLSGQVIPGAKILLLDPAGAIVEQLTSDGEGSFASPRPLAGTYELMVSSAGFTTYRRTLHAEQTGDSARPSSLIVQLGLLGSCPAVDPR